MNTPDTTSNKTWNRRDFLGATLAASMGLATSGLTTVNAQEPAGATVPPAGNQRPLPFNPRTAAAMPMRNLGKTGFLPSNQGFDVALGGDDNVTVVSVRCLRPAIGGREQAGY